MKTKTYLLSAAVGAAALGSLILATENLGAQGGMPANPPLALNLSDSYDLPAADAKTQRITAAALAFLDSLTEEQRTAAQFAFDDNAQRVNWSNFPDPVVARKGVMRGDMTDDQLRALDALLSELLSESGMRNIRLQLAADDASDEGQDFPNFGSAYYYAAFLGTPSDNAPWMFQFGGHHLAINATVFGPDISFSPMMTGGEPLHLTVEGEEVFITESEVMAAQRLMQSFDAAQQAVAQRSEKAAFLMLGPGEDTLRLRPEGLSGADMSEDQRALLLELIEQRLGFMNADDLATRMDQVRADLDETFFAWWGPLNQPGAAYFRTTGPTLVIEYSPEGGGNSADHAHNIYRNPANDYGAAWLRAE